MTIGKAFIALLLAFFWMCFAWFVVAVLTNPKVWQDTLQSWLLVSFAPLMFLLVLAATILIIRLVKNEPGFWSNK